MLMRRYEKGLFFVFFHLISQNDVLLTEQTFVVYNWMSYKYYINIWIMLGFKLQVVQ